MEQNIIVFGLAAVLLGAEMVGKWLASSRTPRFRALLNRWFILTVLLAAVAVFLLGGWITPSVAAAAAVLLIGEATLLAARPPEKRAAKIGLCVVACAVFGSILAVMVLTGAIGTRWKPDPGLMVNEFESAKAKTLARLFAGKLSGVSLLLVTADRLPGMTEQESAAALQSLRTEFGGKGEAAVVEKVPSVVVKGDVKLQFDAAAFDKLVAAHKDRAVVVSLVGLPHDYKNMSSLSAEDGPVFILANQFHSLDPADLSRLLREGRVAACVTLKPGWLHRWRRSPVLPPTPERAFQQRYNLATAESVK